MNTALDAADANATAARRLSMTDGYCLELWRCGIIPAGSYDKQPTNPRRAIQALLRRRGCNEAEHAVVLFDLRAKFCNDERDKTDADSSLVR